MIPETNELLREIKEQLADAKSDLQKARSCSNVIDSLRKMVQSSAVIDFLEPIQKKIDEHPDRAINYIKDILGEWEYILISNRISPCYTDPLHNAVQIVTVDVLSRLYRNLHAALSAAERKC